MVKPAVVLLAALAGGNAQGGAHAAGTMVFSGSIDSASDVDVYRFCAAQGDAIVLSVDGASKSELTPFRANAALLDETGAPLPSFTHAWTAPYTGVYFGRVASDASATLGDYLFSIGIDGRTGAQQVVDLSVTESQVPNPVPAGGLLTYTTQLTNAGPSVALDANVLDVLPVGTTYVSMTSSVAEGIWDCTVPAVGTNGKVSCTNKCFEAGGFVAFVITVQVDTCVGDRQLTNTVTASSSSEESNPADNIASATVTVVDSGTCDDGNVCTVGDACAPGAALEENFDLVSPPRLPAGWIATLVIGPLGATGWRSGTNVCDTEPNSVFTPDAPDVRDAILDSPPIRILTQTAQLIFRNRYDLEVGQDGGVLEIKKGIDPFRDILAVGGSFESGGYNGTISTHFESPIGGRLAWTGSSNGFIPTIVNLPAGWVGQDAVVRWRMATDRALGNIGQWIDTVVVTGAEVCRAGALFACDDNDACTGDSCDAIAGCRHESISCDDGNDCTDDACDSLVQCVHTSNSAACNDHNACTGTDVCLSGSCAGTMPVACGSADACSWVGCDEAIGCVTTTANFDTAAFSAGRVDGRDLAVMARSWNSCPGDSRYEAVANLDRQEACVDATDFHLFMNVFGRTCAP